MHPTLRKPAFYGASAPPLYSPLKGLTSKQTPTGSAADATEPVGALVIGVKGGATLRLR